MNKTSEEEPIKKIDKIIEGLRLEPLTEEEIEEIAIPSYEIYKDKY